MFYKTTALMQNVCETICDIYVTEHTVVLCDKREKV